MNKPSFSNGAAFADLDNDGDLDYVVNNINDKAFVYENTLYHGQKRQATDYNFVRVKLKGSENNRQGLGSKLTLYYDSGKIQYYEQTVYRGFLSSVEEIPHFGLGTVSTVDSIIVQWPDGSIQRIENIGLNSTITIDYDAPGRKILHPSRHAIVSKPTLFSRINTQLNIHFQHEEDDKIDFNLQRTLPHKFTQSGPGLAVGDVNGDGLEDFIIGGSTSYQPYVYAQRSDGTFVGIKKPVRDENKERRR